MRVYCGVSDNHTKESKHLHIDWQLRVLKSPEDIAVFSSKAANSPWAAVRASSVVIDVSIQKLFALLMDGDRVGEYDDLFQATEVRCLLFSSIKLSIKQVISNL